MSRLSGFVFAAGFGEHSHAERRIEKKVIRHSINSAPPNLTGCLLLGILLAGLSTTSYAGFEFKSFRAEPIEISSQSPDFIDYQFSADFKLSCIGNCRDGDLQYYKLGLSDEPIAGNWSVPLTADKLKLTMKENLSYNDSSSGIDMPFSLGDWSGRADPKNKDVMARFSVTLLKSKLETLADDNKPLTFYVVGEDVEASRYHDSIPVNIPVSRKPEVRVSGLTDVALSEQDVNGNYLKAFLSACLYSTSGIVTLNFDGSTAPGQKFQLSNQNDCSGSSECVSYRLYVRNSSEKWTRYKQKNDRPDRAWAANSVDNTCGGNSNLDLRIRIRTKDLPSVAGVYKDTMTVTVSPI